jgi:hypothetical protein
MEVGLMNIVDARTSLRRLSVPRRSVEREGLDRRQKERRQNVVDENMLDGDESGEYTKYVRVSLTPGEKNLLQDMYLIEQD